MDCNLIYVINESYDDTLIHDILNNSLMFICNYDYFYLNKNKLIT